MDIRTNNLINNAAMQDVSSASKLAAPALPGIVTTRAGNSVSAGTSTVNPLSDAELESMIQNGQATAQEAFTVNRNIFTIFKLPDGKVYSRIRDLDSGEIKYFPTLDNFSYQKALQGQAGLIIEDKA